MKACLIDTGPMVALFDASDHYHQKSVEFVKAFSGKLFSSTASVTEAVYLLDFDKNAQTALLTWIARGGVTLEAVTQFDVERVVDLFTKYQDLPMDFADGCLVAIAEKLGIRDVATIDSDFAVYRMFRNKTFNILIGR